MTTPEKRADIAERYGWKPGEREALQRDQAERAERERQARSAENLQWARGRAAARAEAERQPVVKAEETMSSGNTEIWEGWIRNQIKKNQLAADNTMLGAMADLLGKEQRARQTLEAECTVVRQELSALKLEVAELKGEVRGRHAAEAEARQARQPLRSIGTALSA